jgi:UDP-N-acetylmuramoyl-L-alanyl-D-glutamate--2,6-diaminopimelate ligase
MTQPTSSSFTNAQHHIVKFGVKQGVRLADFFEDRMSLADGEGLSEINPSYVDMHINALAIDSRHIQAGTLFFALKGTVPSEQQTEQYAKMTGYIHSALDQGATLVLSEVPPITLGFDHESRIVYVEDLRQKIGGITRRFNQCQNPLTQTMRVAAVTGTNGKTTVTRLLAELWSNAGQLSAVLGTTGNGILPNLTPSTHTTLDALHLQNKLHEYAEQGATLASLEASSHGLEQGRLAGTPVEVAIKICHRQCR